MTNVLANSLYDAPGVTYTPSQSTQSQAAPLGPLQFVDGRTMAVTPDYSLVLQGAKALSGALPGIAEGVTTLATPLGQALAKSQQLEAQNNLAYQQWMNSPQGMALRQQQATSAANLASANVEKEKAEARRTGALATQEQTVADAMSTPEGKKAYSDLRSAQSATAQAQANLTQAEADLKNNQNDVNKQTALATAQSALATARANQTLAEQNAAQAKVVTRGMQEGQPSAVAPSTNVNPSPSTSAAATPPSTPPTTQAPNPNASVDTSSSNTNSNQPSHKVDFNNAATIQKLKSRADAVKQEIASNSAGTPSGDPVLNSKTYQAFYKSLQDAVTKGQLSAEDAKATAIRVYQQAKQ